MEIAASLRVMQSRPPKDLKDLVVTSFPNGEVDLSPSESSSFPFGYVRGTWRPSNAGEPDRLPGCRSIRRALSFAEEKLDGKLRGAHREPAVLHSVRVAQVLAEMFGVRECRFLVIALLHDVIEDSEVEYDEIEQEFGAQVADAVVVLTKPKFCPKPLRKEIYKTALLSAPEGVLLVKLADLYDNLQSRRGRKRVARTWKAAQGLLDGFSARRVGPRVRRAIRIVRDLLADLGREEPLNRALQARLTEESMRAAA